MSVSAYGENPLSPQELEEYITDNAQAIVDAGEDRAALQRELQQQFDEKLKQLRKEKEQLKAIVEQLTARLDKYAKEQQTKHSEDIAGLQKQITANQGTANTAVSNASSAQSTANTAVSNASLAKKAADKAQKAADKAKTTADTADTNASSAQSTANTAVSNAYNAQKAADKAKKTADTAVYNASRAQSRANNAYYKLYNDNLSFPQRGTPVEPDGADKMFHSDSSCPTGRIRSAYKDDHQAAICVCLNAEKGRGWYCFS